MAVGIGYDQSRTVLNEVDSHVVTGLIFRYSVLPDDGFFRDTEVGSGVADTFHMGIGVAFLFVTDQDDTDLSVFLPFIAAVSVGAGCDREEHQKYEQNR